MLVVFKWDDIQNMIALPGTWDKVNAYNNDGLCDLSGKTDTPAYWIKQYHKSRVQATHASVPL